MFALEKHGLELVPILAQWRHRPDQARDQHPVGDLGLSEVQVHLLQLLGLPVKDLENHLQLHELRGMLDQARMREELASKDLLDLRDQPDLKGVASAFLFPYLIQLDQRANCNEIAFYKVDWCDTRIRHQIMIVYTIQLSILGRFIISFVDMVAKTTMEDLLRALLLYPLLDEYQL